MESAHAGPDRLSVPDHSHIDNVVAVMSGKGGVGKSSVAALLASTLRKQGYSVGILDADITGPSIPRLFSLRGVPKSSPEGMLPPQTPSGIPIMSINLLLAHEDDPVIWRGPLIARAVQQFWSEVVWGNLDYLVIDLPPGTGDSPLTVLQSLPLDGIVIVSSPQEMALMVIKKAIRMARSLQVPIIGLVENMSGICCPHCGEIFPVFGDSRAASTCSEEGLRWLGNIPLDPVLASVSDQGRIEDYEVDFLEAIPDVLSDVKGGV